MLAKAGFFLLTLVVPFPLHQACSLHVMQGGFLAAHTGTWRFVAVAVVDVIIMVIVAVIALQHK